MSVKSYEKFDFIVIIVFMLILLELIFGYYLFSNKLYRYKKISGIIENKNIVEILVDKKERNIIYKNSKVLINDKYYKYTIYEDLGVITRRNNINYYDIVLHINYNDNKYMTNDVLELVFMEKKISIIKLLIDIVVGD